MVSVGASITFICVLLAACGVGQQGASPLATEGGGHATPSPAISMTALPSIPELSGWHLARTIEVPGYGFMTVGAGAVWAVDRADGGFTDGVPNGDIYKIDPATGRVVDRIRHARGGFPTVGEGALWLVNAEFGQSVTRVDLKTKRVTRFRTSDSEDPVPEAIVVTPGAVWVGNNHDGTVARVDPRTTKVVKTIPLSTVGGVRGDATTDGSSVWFPITETREIVRIDVATAEVVSRMQLPLVKHANLPAELTDERASAPVFLLVVGDQLYASTFSDLYVIDVSEPGAENVIADIPTEGMGPAALAAGPDPATVWALIPDPAVLLQIDTANYRIAGRLPLPAVSEEGVTQPSIGVIADAIWLRFPGSVLELTR